MSDQPKPTTGEQDSWRTRGTVKDSSGTCHIRITHTTALDAAIEQKRLEIWADAPNQPDIQEAVIAKLDLVHRDAISKATKDLRDQLADGYRMTHTAIAAAQQPLVELLEQVLQETVDAIDYPDGPCLNADTRTEIKTALAKVKEGK